MEIALTLDAAALYGITAARAAYNAEQPATIQAAGL